MATAFHDRPKYFELVDGRRYAKVSPQRTHSLLQGWLLRRLGDAASGRGEVGTEWKFYLGRKPGLRNALQPDVSFVSYERLAVLTPAQREKPRLAPDIAIEIRSPGDRPGVLKRKIARYLAKGFLVAIEVNPQKRIAIARTVAGEQVFHDGETFVSEAVPWFSFQLRELFAAAWWAPRR